MGSPRIVILDDSASALDLKTDAALRRALAGMSVTRIVVSQRVSSVRSADQILVMRRGKAVGLGTHDELLRACTVYQEICASQGVDDRAGHPALEEDTRRARPDADEGGEN